MPSARCTSPISPWAVAAGARVRAGVEARSLIFERDRAIGARCVRGVADVRQRRERPFTVRARKAVIVAAGAFGTPELLLRSGVRSPSGELGRNLRIHPACWVELASTRRSAAGTG